MDKVLDSGKTAKLAYSVREAAELISVHPHQIRLLIAQGYLPTWKCGGAMRIRRRDIERLMGFDIPALRPKNTLRQEGIA